MPRRSASGHQPDRDALYDIAAPQAGYFSLSQANDAGFSKQLLQFYLRDGRIDRAGRGIFRLRHFPSTFEHEDLVPVWLWTDQVGVFSHETALALHQLSDALPSKHHVTVPLAWRARLFRTPPGSCCTTLISMPTSANGLAQFRSPRRSARLKMPRATGSTQTGLRKLPSKA